MKKKIGLVLFAPIDYSETFFLNQVRLWEASGYEVIVFTGYSERPILENYKLVMGLPIHFNTIKSWFLFLIKFFSLLFKAFFPGFRFVRYELNDGSNILQSLKKLYLIAHILPYKVDYLHFGFADTAVGKEFLAKTIQARMSISIWGADISVYPIMNPCMYTKVWKHTAIVHSASMELYKKAIQFGLSSNAVFQIILPTLDLKQVSYPERDGILNEPLRILTVARLHWKKGLEFALMTVKELIQSGIKVQYTIIGSGNYEQAIRYTIRDLGLEEFVTLTLKLPYNKVLEHMKTSDIYIQTSVQEGFCLAVLEAQASGLMVVSTDAEGIRENIENGLSGWIVPKRDVPAMTQKIKDIISMSVLERRNISEYARKRIDEQFFFDKTSKAWINFFT